MTFPTVDWGDYISANGTLTESEWWHEIAHAQAYVNYLIYPVVSGEDEMTYEQKDAYYRAVFAAVDTFAQYGWAPVGGFSIDSFRMDAGETSDPQVLVQRAIIPFLAPVGLLFQGIR